MKRYEAIKHKVLAHPDGRVQSIFSAAPHDGGWEIEQRGWTVRDNRANTTGIGRPPWKTREEAEAFAITHNVVG